MTQQNDNYETPPAVEPTHYDGLTKGEERAWIQGTSRLIMILAAVFLAIVLVYALAR